jgi:geranylgeranyl diphosphate synthase type I
MDVKEILKQYKGNIDHQLRLFFDSKIKRVKTISPYAVEMLEHLKEFTLRGGKRIRPVLTIFGYKAIGGRDEEAITQAALAVELMESYLLIHDDIMDQDELRRGYLTIHKIYENKSKRLFSTEHKRFGESMAIIAGDILAILGSEAIAYARFPQKNKIRAIDKFNRVVINTCFGQILDIRSELENDIKEENILRTHELKTAVYTIEGPLHIGALLAGASEKQLKVLSNYAIPLGQAFQIQDDILGMFGEQKKLGKPIGSDLKEGKKTLLIVKALERANDTEKKIILQGLGNKNLSDKEIDKIKSIIKVTDSLAYSQELAIGLINRAKSVMVSSKFRKDAKNFLVGIADYMLNREY